MWIWRRVVAKYAMFAFVLSFALQAIAAPALCAIHDQTSTSTGASDFVSPAATTQVQQTAAVSARLVVHGAGQSRHEDTELERCDVPVLPFVDTPVPAPTPSNVVDMAPAWHQATLRPPSSGSALPARWTRLAPPPAQGSTLDIAPRLRI